MDIYYAKPASKKKSNFSLDFFSLLNYTTAPKARKVGKPPSSAFPKTEKTMKTKTYTTLALALAVSGCAWATEVVSSNVVGYQKLSIPANGYALLANPFTQVGSSGETFPINDMFADDVGQSNGGMNSGAADQIKPWNSTAQGYTTTYYFSSRINKWSSGSPMVAASTSLEPADGYWYFNRGSEAISLTVSGEVSTNDVPVVLVPGYTLVCNPFPAALKLNDGDIDWETAGSHGGMNSGAADQIKPWNSTAQGYTTTYYFSSRINKWSSGSPMTPTTASIAPGEGFWYYNKGPETIYITLKSPLASSNQ